MEGRSEKELQEWSNERLIVTLFLLFQELLRRYGTIMSPVSFVTVDGNQATAFETHPDWDQNTPPEDEAAAAADQEDQEHLNDGEE